MARYLATGESVQFIDAAAALRMSDTRDPRASELGVVAFFEGVQRECFAVSRLDAAAFEIGSGPGEEGRHGQ
ncbi:MAG TPA: hypothetical protein VKB50_16930 [Vicinamibacterales bacterium]|nr:hypothetical protein [Vicinamibacterales bacterium]